ncbi:MAG: lactate utilization protein [Candidatus Rokubacteria bacterium]|nr:lactate utilization protein [Candidatus Rokubacteria bacterium]
MTTRGQFLAQVRREMAKTRGLFPARSAERPADPAAFAQAIRRQLAERWPEALTKFREEFERVGGAFYHATGKEEALQTICRIAKERSAQRVITWATSPLGAELGSRLRAEGLEVMEEAPGGIGEVERPGFRQASAQADIGITGVDLAVAETGSLVVISGPGKARSASLLPPYHIALFGKEALVETLEQLGVIFEAIHRDPDRSMSAASISFITGPSRTADIELTLTRGVHGPKEVHAVFIESR